MSLRMDGLGCLRRGLCAVEELLLQAAQRRGEDMYNPSIYSDPASAVDSALSRIFPSRLPSVEAKILWLMLFIAGVVASRPLPTVAECMPPRQSRLLPERVVPVRACPPLDAGPARPTALQITAMASRNTSLETRDGVTAVGGEQSSLAPSLHCSTSVPSLSSAPSFSVVPSASSVPSAVTGWIPPRNDGQGTSEYSRGSKRLAIQIASDPAALRSASTELKDQVFSKTNKHSVAIKLGTWAEIAVAAGYSDPYSLSVDMLYDVAAALWKAKYRSVDSYLTVARQEMILKHGSIPESLLLHFRRVSRAAARGRGPAKQANELPFLRLQELGDTEVPLSLMGPCFPGRFAVIASWWMLREIEANNLTLNCISLAEEQAHVVLPTSKMDPTGRGTTRSLCCTCSSLPSRLCPFHAFQSQVIYASSRGTSPNSPLFPTISGDSASKTATGESIVKMAELLGLELQTRSGAPRFTGHSFRVTGAMFLASSGIDVWRIQIHGRWGSATVLKYVRLAPLTKSLALEVSLGKDLTDVRSAILDAKATLAGMSIATNKVMEDDALVTALGPQLGKSASYLGAPKLDHILGNQSVKGWHRVPDMDELLVSNIGPPNFDGKLHSLRPPQLHLGIPPAWDEWTGSSTKAWCNGWDFIAAKERKEYVVWDGSDEMKLLPLCGRCFGKVTKKVSSSSSASSSGA